MRENPNGELIATATCSVNTEIGTVYITFSSDQTENIPFGKYGFDIWIVSDNIQKPIYTELVEVVGSYTTNMGDE